MAENSLFAILLRSLVDQFRDLHRHRGRLQHPAAQGHLAVCRFGRSAHLHHRLHGRVASAQGPEQRQGRGRARRSRRHVVEAICRRAPGSRLGQRRPERSAHHRPGGRSAAGEIGTVSLVSARRWKAATHGVEPLKELNDAVVRLKAQYGVYVVLQGTVSETARAFAKEHGLLLLEGDALAAMLLKSKSGKA